MKYIVLYCLIILSNLTIGQRVTQKHQLDFADQLLKKKIISTENYQQLVKDIEQKKLSKGILEFLPYCENAKVIKLSEIEKNTENKAQYLAEIINQIASIHPDIQYSNFYTCINGSGPCPIPDITYNYSVSFEHNHVYYHSYLDTEIGILYMLNTVLRDNKSNYQIVLVYNEDANSGAVDQEEDFRQFGVIALKKSQLDGLVYYSEKTELFSAAYYPRYITSSNKKKAIATYKEIGLFDHLSVPEIRKATYKALNTRVTNFNDIIGFFPGTVWRSSYQELEKQQKMYVYLTDQLMNLSKGDLQLTELDDDWEKAKKHYQDGSLSFKWGDKSYHYPFEEYYFNTPDYLILLNKLLSDHKINKGFRRLYITVTDEQNQHDLSITYLTDKQYQVLSEKDYLSFLPEDHVMEEQWYDFERGIRGSWEQFYPKEKEIKYHYDSDEFYPQLECKSIGEALKDPENVKTLYLSRKNLREVPKEVGQLVNLRNLYLEGNQLTTLPPEIGNLKELRYLNIWRNNIDSLPGELFQLKKLRQLILSENNLTTLPPEIGQLESLDQLFLYENQLTSIPPEFGQLKNLTWLKLNDNQLTFLPPEFGDLYKLHWLDISSNKLKKLPLEFNRLSGVDSFTYGNNLFDEEELKRIMAWQQKQLERMFWTRPLVD